MRSKIKKKLGFKECPFCSNLTRIKVFSDEAFNYGQCRKCKSITGPIPKFSNKFLSKQGYKSVRDYIQKSGGFYNI